ncbi:hypothetical protein HYH03_003027 [Edaphochlamys debaryana]|uniref:Uncharacterized protein n=1 Tax=Edaphochlamys debaryana TaxID=47281 RepID=A0A836C4J3_9CHLO|nr:hypothetical protein HYH03_003027 [Edaphochlamys debaryana]|eukprot:KAG2498834.1 hypothetical protein HYH03_003027 [Edaphochlamys debaryana]
MVGAVLAWVCQLPVLGIVFEWGLTTLLGAITWLQQVRFRIRGAILNHHYSEGAVLVSLLTHWALVPELVNDLRGHPDVGHGAVGVKVVLALLSWPELAGAVAVLVWAVTPLLPDLMSLGLLLPLGDAGSWLLMQADMARGQGEPWATVAVAVVLALGTAYGLSLQYEFSAEDGRAQHPSGTSWLDWCVDELPLLAALWLGSFSYAAAEWMAPSRATTTAEKAWVALQLPLRALWTGEVSRAQSAWRLTCLAALVLGLTLAGTARAVWNGATGPHAGHSSLWRGACGLGGGLVKAALGIAVGASVAGMVMRPSYMASYGLDAAFGDYGAHARTNASCPKDLVTLKHHTQRDVVAWASRWEGVGGCDAASSNGALWWCEVATGAKVNLLAARAWRRGGMDGVQAALEALRRPGAAALKKAAVKAAKNGHVGTALALLERLEAGPGFGRKPKAPAATRGGSRRVKKAAEEEEEEAEEEAEEEEEEEAEKEAGEEAGEDWFGAGVEAQPAREDDGDDEGEEEARGGYGSEGEDEFGEEVHIYATFSPRRTCQVAAFKGCDLTTLKRHWRELQKGTGAWCRNALARALRYALCSPHPDWQAKAELLVSKGAKPVHEMYLKVCGVKPEATALERLTWMKQNRCRMEPGFGIEAAIRANNREVYRWLSDNGVWDFDEKEGFETGYVVPDMVVQDNVAVVEFFEEIGWMSDVEDCLLEGAEAGSARVLRFAWEKLGYPTKDCSKSAVVKDQDQLVFAACKSGSVEIMRWLSEDDGAPYLLAIHPSHTYGDWRMFPLLRRLGLALPQPGTALVLKSVASGAPLGTLQWLQAEGACGLVDWAAAEVAAKARKPRQEDRAEVLAWIGERRSQQPEPWRAAKGRGRQGKGDAKGNLPKICDLQ